MEDRVKPQAEEKTLEDLKQENAQLREGYISLSQRLIGLRMVQHIAQDLVSELDVDRLLKRILRAAINAAGGTAGALLLLDPSGHELVFAVVEGGGGTDLEGQRMGAEQGLAGWVLTHNKSVIVADAREDERFFHQIPEGVSFEVTSMICVPLAARGVRIGVVQVLNKAQGGQFDNDDLDLLTSFAAQSASAIENARLYQELRRERDRILAIEEDVRRRLARDLHDGPAQLLAAIILSVEFLEKLLGVEPEKVPRELEKLEPLCQKALRQVRTLLFDLRPVILETQGLGAALESYVQKQKGVEDLSYHLQTAGFVGRLVAPVERAIFSIIQEAVGNVKKHARARNVWIAMTEQNGRLLVGVRDDGRGFEVNKLNAEYDQRGSLGMLNMRERAESIGGKLLIKSQPGAGTTVALIADLAPLRSENQDR